MDSMMPYYPPFSPIDAEPKPTPPSQVYPRLSSPSTASPSSEADRASHSRHLAPSSEALDPSHLHLHPHPHPYSPTAAEIESHPIRQRLETSRDDEAPAFPSETEANGSESREDDLRQAQAQEGSERLVDAAMGSEAPNVKEGDAVSYNWSGGKPGGEVTQVESHGAVTMTTKRGNEVSKQGEADNPAVYIERDGHDVVKKASEVQIDEKGDKHKEGEDKKEEEKKPEEPEKKETNGEAQTGDKRAAEEPAEDKKAEAPKRQAKKQKTESKPKENGEAPKKKGRPAKTDADGKPAAKKDTKKRAPKKAATESGEPRRSGRNKA